jgi:hypothetical protein
MLMFCSPESDIELPGAPLLPWPEPRRSSVNSIHLGFLLFTYLLYRQTFNDENGGFKTNKVKDIKSWFGREVGQSAESRPSGRLVQVDWQTGTCLAWPMFGLGAPPQSFKGGLVGGRHWNFLLHTAKC